MKLRIERMSWQPGIQLLRINGIAGDSERRDDRHEVEEENLPRQEWQEGKERRRSRQAEHVPEIGTDGDTDIFARVGEGLPAESHTVSDDVEALIEEDDGCRLSCDVHGRVNRDADIGGVKGSGVVDAVSEEADHLSRLSKRPDYAFLLKRFHLREDDQGSSSLGELHVREAIDLATGQDVRGGQPDLLSHLACREGIVTRHDPHRDPEASSFDGPTPGFGGSSNASSP
jgi:hypothetical protein